MSRRNPSPSDTPTAAHATAPQNASAVPLSSDADVIAHRRGWLAHVEAGRIGGGAGTTSEQLLQQLRNEEAVLGRARSVRFVDGGAWGR